MQPQQTELPRIVCVVGPTSSGKTSLGIRLAKSFSGEIINADSRQVYKKCDIGTGKPAGKRGLFEGHRAFFVQDVPHYMMDFLDPAEVLTVVEWREKAERGIRGILSRQHLPVIVGGTGLYISSLVNNFDFPRVPPNPTLRAAFEKKTLRELVQVLLTQDPDAAEMVDLKNPRRVVRALEVLAFTGKPFTQQKTSSVPEFDAFQVGIWRDRDEMYRRVEETVGEMVLRGWADEIRALLADGVSEETPAMNAIGYREMLQYVKGKSSLEEAVEKTKQAVRRYAKRQVTWFKRDPRIRWAATEDEAVEMTQEWLRR